LEYIAFLIPNGELEVSSGKAYTNLHSDVQPAVRTMQSKQTLLFGKPLPETLILIDLSVHLLHLKCTTLMLQHDDFTLVIS